MASLILLTGREIRPYRSRGKRFFAICWLRVLPLLNCGQKKDGFKKYPEQGDFVDSPVFEKTCVFRRHQCVDDVSGDFIIGGITPVLGIIAAQQFPVSRDDFAGQGSLYIHKFRL